MPCNTLFVRFAAFWLLLGYSCSTVLAASHARPTITLALLGALSSAVRGWISYDPQGEATMTHYTMERNFIAACGCTADSTHYPTAGMLLPPLSPVLFLMASTLGSVKPDGLRLKRLLRTW